MSWSVSALVMVLLWSVVTPWALRAFHRGRSPSARVMIALWMLAGIAWLLSCVALLVTLATQMMGSGVKAFIAACIDLVQAVHTNGAESGLVVLGLLATAGLTRLAWTAVRRYRDRTAWVREHLGWLAYSARQRTVHLNRVWLLDSPDPLAYCLPGKNMRIVVTSGTLEHLTEPELRAVLAHEQAHLKGRHHLLLTWIRLLDTAFPGVPLLRAAATDVPELVEWAADDHAAREAGPHALAHALGVMATAQVRSPESALSMSGACPVRRVRRQIGPRRGTSGVVENLGAALVLLLPLALTVVATVMNVASPYCECVG